MSARDFYNDGWKPNPQRHYESEMAYWFDFAEAYAAASKWVWVNPHKGGEDDLAEGGK
jgi:hypothetical protein